MTEKARQDRIGLAVAFIVIFYVLGVWGHRPGTTRGSGSGDHRTGRPSDIRVERFLPDESVADFVRI